MSAADRERLRRHAAGVGEPEPPMPVSCISCGAPWNPDADPAITTLGVRCSNCWAGRKPTSRLDEQFARRFVADLFGGE